MVIFTSASGSIESISYDNEISDEMINKFWGIDYTPVLVVGNIVTLFSRNEETGEIIRWETSAVSTEAAYQKALSEQQSPFD